MNALKRKGLGFMVLNATFSYIVAVSLIGVPGENHRPIASHK